MPAPDSLSISFLQLRSGDFRVRDVQRIANSLVGQSDPLEVVCHDDLTVTAGYELTRPQKSAWLLAKSPTVVTHISVRAATTEALSPDQATQKLQAQANLLGLNE